MNKIFSFVKLTYVNVNSFVYAQHNTGWLTRLEAFIPIMQYLITIASDRHFNVYARNHIRFNPSCLDCSVIGSLNRQPFFYAQNTANNCNSSEVVTMIKVLFT